MIEELARERSAAARSPNYEALAGHLAARARAGHARDVEEERGIYRDEVRAMWKLADIDVAVREILRYLQGDDDEWEEEEEEDSPDA